MKLIFDLDGTLIDSAPDIHAAGTEALAAEGLPPISADLSRSFIGNGAGIYVARAEQAAAGASDPARLARMRKRFIEVYEVSHSRTQVYPGVPEMLEALHSKGWRLGLCTNKPIGPTRSVLAHFGWAGIFDAVTGGDSLPVRKPDPAPLLAVIDAMGGGPVGYVGDSEVDAQTAQAAKVPFALFTKGYRKLPVAEITNEYSFDFYGELPAIAESLVAMHGSFGAQAEQP